MTCIFMDHNKRLDHILLYHIIPLNMHAVIGLVNRYQLLKTSICVSILGEAESYFSKRLINI